MRSFLLAAVALLLPSLALAEPVELPLDLTWCAPRDEVLAKLDSPSELMDDMVEANLKLWNVDGVIRVVFEEDRLATVRFRIFETPENVERLKQRLDALLGEGTGVGTPDETGYHRRYRYTAGEDEKVELTRQSEQVYAHFEIPATKCQAAIEKQDGPTEQEKRDLESVARKDAIEFDPFAEDIDEVEKAQADAARKKKEEEEAKAREEAKKEDEDGDGEPDVEIDW